MLKLGNVNLGEQPAIAIAIQDTIEPGAITAACPGAIVELRLDAFKDPTPETCAAFSACYGSFPTLATIRHADEGGGWQGTEAERLACFKAVMPLVDAVDVEIAVGSIAGEAVALAHDGGKLAIGSFHDFDATPDEEHLEQVHKAGRKAGVDIVKVAARCNAPEDLQRLAAFTLAHREEGIIVVGMGPHGLSSRVFFPALGSLITYTFLGAPTAPGQLNCSETLRYLNDFYPQGVATSRS